MIAYLEYLSIALIPAFLILDLVPGKRQYSKPRWWKVRGLVVTVCAFAIAMAVGLFWGAVLGDFHLLQGSELGVAGGAVFGILVYELFHYWYHRLAHTSNVLWRMGHQMHHSAESIDAFGAYYMHPLDVVFFTTLGSLVFFPLLGLEPMAGALAAVFLTFNAMFQHANISTPQWLGYLIQRPESHCVHHGRGIHQYNYSDLPLWDILFGTFRNPKSVEKMPAGFYLGGSTRIRDMLAFRDIANIPGEPVQPAARQTSPGANPELTWEP